MPSPGAFAVFSDIHSNLQALEAALADMVNLGVSQAICLGDIVGYAAQPRECMEIVHTLECPVLKGNHDSAVVDLDAHVTMRDIAQAGIEFSRSKLPEFHRNYLNDLPLKLTIWDCQFVHASLHQQEDWIYLNRSQDIREHFAIQRIRSVSAATPMSKESGTFRRTANWPCSAGSDGSSFHQMARS